MTHDNIARGLQGIERAGDLLPEGTPLMFWSAGNGALAPAEAYLGPTAFTEPGARIRDVRAELSPASLWEARWWLFWAIRDPDLVVPPNLQDWEEVQEDIFGPDDTVRPGMSYEEILEALMQKGPDSIEPALFCSAAMFLPLARLSGTEVADWARDQRVGDLILVPPSIRGQHGIDFFGAESPTVVGLVRGFPGQNDLPLLRGPGAFQSPSDWVAVERHLSSIYPVSYSDNNGVATVHVSETNSQIISCHVGKIIDKVTLIIGGRSIELNGRATYEDLVFDRSRMGFWVYHDAIEQRLGWRPPVPATRLAEGRQSQWVLERRR
jgi:hypothetical protein